MSKKINVSLVGGQPTPVFLFIKHDKPDGLVLICSGETEKYAKTIEGACKEALHIKETLVKSIDANDVGLVKMAITEIDNIISAYDAVSVNITGGTKTWSILFFQHFSRKDNASCYYIDQNNTIWDFEKDKKVKNLEGLTINEVLMLNNFKARHADLCHFVQEDRDMVSRIRMLRRYNIRAFTEIIKKFSKYKSPPQSRTEQDEREMCKMHWDLQGRQFLCEFRNRSGVYNECFHSPHVWKLLTNYGWFELEVALFLNNWHQVKEMWLGCEMLGKVNPGTLNEFDIIINTGAKLLFIECKTQINNITDVDKFNNGIKEYGGVGCKGLFVTDVEMKPAAKEKCDNYNIPHFCLGDIRKNKERENLFFRFLDEHMNTVNEK